MTEKESGFSEIEGGKEKRIPKERISVIGADIAAITGSGNSRDTDWVIVFDTDPLYEQLRKTTNGTEVKPVDETDLEMAEKGYTQYSYADREYETEKE